MSFTDRPTMRINSTNDLLAFLPFVLGFHPQASLVLAGLAESGIPLAARLTLPAATDPSGPFDAALQQTVAGLTALPDVSVVLVGYGPADQVEPAVTAAARMLRRRGHPDPRIAARSRRPVLAAAPRPGHRRTATRCAVRPGQQPGHRRRRLRRPGRVARPRGVRRHPGPGHRPGPHRHGRRHRRRLHPAHRPDGRRHPADRHRSGRGAGHTARTRAATGGAHLPHPDPEQLPGRAAGRRRARRDPDRPAGTALPWEFAARQTTAAAWQIAMWTDLVRRAEPEFATVPATLLALCALQAGNGALATIAVDRALTTDPDDHFAHLLARSIDAGIDPDTVAALLAD